MSGRFKVYGDITQKYIDLTDDDNLVALFLEVLARRDILDKQKNNLVDGESPLL